MKIRQRFPHWPGDLTHIGSYGRGDGLHGGTPPGHAVLEEATLKDAPTGKTFVEMRVRFNGRREVSRLTTDKQDADRLIAFLNDNKGQTLDNIAHLDFAED